MSLVIDYGNIGRSDSVDYNIVKEVNKLKKYLNERSETQTNVWISKVNKNIDNRGVPEYKVALQVKCGKNSNLYISKSDDEFLRCLGRVFNSAVKKVRREKGKIK